MLFYVIQTHSLPQTARVSFLFFLLLSVGVFSPFFASATTPTTNWPEIGHFLESMTFVDWLKMINAAAAARDRFGAFWFLCFLHAVFVLKCSTMKVFHGTKQMILKSFFVVIIKNKFNCVQKNKRKKKFAPNFYILFFLPHFFQQFFISAASSTRILNKNRIYRSEIIRKIKETKKHNSFHHHHSRQPSDKIISFFGWPPEATNVGAFDLSM